MNKNYCIKCDVKKCRHNDKECNCCQLDSIKVSNCCGENCTCCSDYSEQE